MKKIITLILLCVLASCGGGSRQPIEDRKVSLIAEDSSVALMTPDDVLNLNIRTYIDRLFYIDISNMQRSAYIRTSAEANNISYNAISKAIGYDLDIVTSFLNQSINVDPLPIPDTELEKLKPLIDVLNIKDVSIDNKITITGKWLSMVKNIKFNSRDQLIIKKGYWTLDFMIDKDECGSMDAEMLDNTIIHIGYRGITNICSGKIAELSLAQNLVYQPKWINGKSLGVRAMVISSRFPENITVRVLSDGHAIYEGIMTPPSFKDVSTRITNGSAYTTVIPGEYIKQGIRIDVVGNAKWDKGIEFVSSIVPNIGPKLLAGLTLVPLNTSDGLLANIPSEKEIRDVILQYLPLPDNTVIKVLPPVLLTMKMDTNDNWYQMINQMQSIRSSVVSSDWWVDNSIFYGFVPNQGAGIAGIAYLNSQVAVGIDSKYAWERVMTHELGHVFGRPHAPCGNVAGPDVDYPYLGGIIGPIRPYDMLLSLEVDTESILSQNHYDVMGYCSGHWFSDYNYNKIVENVESRWTSSVKLEMINTPSFGYMIKISESGSIVLESENIINPGRSSGMVPIISDTNITNGQLYRIDHAPFMRMWVEGVPGNITFTIDGKSYNKNLKR